MKRTVGNGKCNSRRRTPRLTARCNRRRAARRPPAAAVKPIDGNRMTEALRRGENGKPNNASDNHEGQAVDIENRSPTAATTNTAPAPRETDQPTAALRPVLFMTSQLSTASARYSRTFVTRSDRRSAEDRKSLESIIGAGGWGRTRALPRFGQSGVDSLVDGDWSTDHLQRQVLHRPRWLDNEVIPGKRVQAITRR